MTPFDCSNESVAAKMRGFSSEFSANIPRPVPLRLRKARL
jgi:hypothetical protein